MKAPKLQYTVIDELLIGHVVEWTRIDLQETEDIVPMQELAPSTITVCRIMIAT